MTPQTSTVARFAQSQWDQLPAEIRDKAQNLYDNASRTIDHPITHETLDLEPEPWIEQCHIGPDDPDFYQLVLWYWNGDDQNLYATIDLS